MKKIMSSLLVGILTLSLSFTSVSASTSYNVNKIIDAAEQVKKYYERNGLSESNYFNDIIAYEALHGEVEEKFDILNYENKVSGNISNLGGLSKAIITSKLIGKNPTNLIINGESKNLVESLENLISEDGCFGERQGCNNEIWGLLALESVSSPKVGLVANHIADMINEDGGFWNFGYDSNWSIDYNKKESSCDVTGWALEALSIAGKDNYSSTILSAIQYLKNNQGDEGDFLSYGIANPDTQACAIEGLSVYDRSLLLNGDYDKNNINPIDKLLSFQNTEIGSFWYNYTGEDNGYATQDGARAIGTLIYGSVIYKCNGTSYEELVRNTNVDNNQQSPTDETPENTNNTQTTTSTNEKVQSVQTGDESQVGLFMTVSMVSGALYLVLRKEYERVH